MDLYLVLNKLEVVSLRDIFCFILIVHFVSFQNDKFFFFCDLRFRYSGQDQKCNGTPIVEFSNTIMQCFITPFENNRTSHELPQGCYKYTIGCYKGVVQNNV